jgi:Sel1 repeat
MTRRWKFAIAICLALCAVGLLTRISVRVLKKRELVRTAEATRVRAEKGDANAQFNLSSAYFYGQGVPQNYNEAARWCRRAAEQGSAVAESHLGSLYLYGNGVPQDYTEAARWYRKAAEQNEPTGELGIAAAYFYGKGTPQDYTEAIRWYRKSAEQGDARAQFSLGSIYSQGTGVQQDNAEAIRWYRKSASQGDAGAEYALGYMYYKGLGLPRDYNAALRWLHASADHGSTDAQLVLSSLERRSTTARTIDYSTFFIALGGGLFFLLDFMRSGKSLRTSLHPVALGIVCLCYAGLSLYGITHDRMRYSACRNLFYLTKGVMIGMVVILGLAIVMAPTRKKIDVREAEPNPRQ